MSDKTEPDWVPAKDTRWEIRCHDEDTDRLETMATLLDGFQPFAVLPYHDGDTLNVWVYFRREMVRAGVKL